MDLRREMWQSIYLSGGTTLIEGFAERLETELKLIAPPSVAVQVWLCDVIIYYDNETQQWVYVVSYYMYTPSHINSSQ